MRVTGVFKSSGTLCRAASDAVCDAAEFCNGYSGNCPTDVWAVAGTPCTDSSSNPSGCYAGKCALSRSVYCTSIARTGCDLSTSCTSTACRASTSQTYCSSVSTFLPKDGTPCGGGSNREVQFGSICVAGTCTNITLVQNNQLANTQASVTPTVVGFTYSPSSVSPSRSPLTTAPSSVPSTRTPTTPTSWSPTKAPVTLAPVPPGCFQSSYAPGPYIPQPTLTSCPSCEQACYSTSTCFYYQYGPDVGASYFTQKCPTPTPTTSVPTAPTVMPTSSPTLPYPASCKGYLSVRVNGKFCTDFM